MRTQTLLSARRNLLPLSLIGTGFLILILLPGIWMYQQAQSNPGSAPLPGSIAGSTQTAALSGHSATVEFSRLHGKAFPLTSGSMGVYGQDRQVTIWVAGTPAGWLTSRMVSAMRDKIAQGKSPFQPLEDRRDGKRVVYALEGMGQKHFYFQSGTLLIWLAAEYSVAEQALTDVLTFYP